MMGIVGEIEEDSTAKLIEFTRLIVKVETLV